MLGSRSRSLWLFLETKTKKKQKQKNFAIALVPTYLSMNFNIISHNCWLCNISSNFNLQEAGLKVKVTVAVFRKKKEICHHSSPCIYQWILIYLHTIAGYYNILSKFNFKLAGLKVKVTVAIFRKKVVITLFLEKKSCHHSRTSPCIYQSIFIYLHTFVGIFSRYTYI